MNAINAGLYYPVRVDGCAWTSWFVNIRFDCRCYLFVTQVTHANNLYTGWQWEFQQLYANRQHWTKNSSVLSSSSCILFQAAKPIKTRQAKRQRQTKKHTNTQIKYKRQAIQVCWRPVVNEKEILSQGANVGRLGFETHTLVSYSIVHRLWSTEPPPHPSKILWPETPSAPTVLTGSGREFFYDFDLHQSASGCK